MSQNMKRASRVEILLLNNSFSVVISDALVMTPPWIFDKVAVKCDAGTIWVIFWGATIHKNPTLCYIFISVDYCRAEKHCVYAFHHATNPFI